MSRKAKTDAKTAPNAKKKAVSPSPPDRRNAAQKRADSIRTAGYRETVEAFIVAFLLALLFRAFVAEAFVIPTGSMAPTLMGAHKDVSCAQCEHRFQIGASRERSGAFQMVSVVAGVCPNCRFVNSLDLVGDKDHGTFNGDRILVSKFAYTISEPDRWDVIVFKYPGNPKQNYIKRLVGLPNETISIQYGDLYSSPSETPNRETILRKPVDKLLAMRHHVYDTDQQSPLLIEAGYPSRLQPWRPGASEPPSDSWQINRTLDGVIASLKDDSGTPQWLRYFHHWPSFQQWDAVTEKRSLSDVDPYSSRLITDFYAYNCYINVESKQIYQDHPSNARWAGSPPLRPDYQSAGGLEQFGGRPNYGSSDAAYDGLHWVGDLIAEADVETTTDCKSLTLELVEAGIQYQCRIDLTDGSAEWVMIDAGETLSFATDGSTTATPKAQLDIRAGDFFSVRYSNCDDQLLLWINDDLVAFDNPTTFDVSRFRDERSNRPHYRPNDHPLDASPVGIAVSGGKATVTRMRIDRDKYYIATNDSREINDYSPSEFFNAMGTSFNPKSIQAVMATPSEWASYPGWQTRQRVSFKLEEDQYFPMGDNSPESLDARCWTGARGGGRLPERFHDQAYEFAKASYVPRDLLVGKAFAVFWPHPWRTPVPMTPNFNRIRLIR